MIEKLTVNEHSSIRISSDKVIYFDPFRLSKADHDADIIFITHDHYDHFSPEDIEKCAGANTLFVAPYTMARTFKKAKINEDSVTLMHAGYSAEVLGIPIDAVASYNTIKPFHPHKNGWLGYVVTLEGKRIYVCGDTDATPEAKAVTCDIICVPIGGTYTMGAKQAAELVNLIRPEIAVPTHYGSIIGKPADADIFAAHVDPAIQVVKKLR